MYSSDTFRFSSEEKMMEFLKKVRPSEPDQPIGIVGGHFMLLYDKDEDCLKPVIHQDLEDPKLKAFAKLMAEDFPVNSFEYSVMLQNYYTNLDFESKIIFIVNDHIFQSNNFQPGISKYINNRGGELRKEFYRSTLSLPQSYISMLNNYKLETKDLILNNDKKNRSPNAILPKNSIYYSEQALRTRFDKKTKKKLLKRADFYEEYVNNEKELFFEENSGSLVCLTENGECGCSLEVVEFISKLIKRNMKTIVFFSPIECEAPVNLGIKAAMHIQGSNKLLKSNIYLITGVEDKNNLSGNITSHRYS